MTDQEFLIWIHERLEFVHDENPLIDYMHKLRAVISATPKNQITPNMLSFNSLEELKKHMEIGESK